MGGSDVHDMSYYGKCMIGGILSCGLTHMAMCPIDIVKCRKQVRCSYNYRYEDKRLQDSHEESLVTCLKHDVR